MKFVTKKVIFVTVKDPETQAYFMKHFSVPWLPPMPGNPKRTFVVPNHQGGELSRFLECERILHNAEVIEE